MAKLNFSSDYLKGAHPNILKKLEEINDDINIAYGLDKYSKSASKKIKDVFGLKNSEVFFLVGGTQTNETVISTILKPYEGVLSATTGHINCHEAGAVEYTGHKVLPIPSHDGKINPNELKNYLVNFYNDGSYSHMVFPGLLYISHPTEYGTLYSKKELEEISKICKSYNIPIFLDGARLGYGLMSYDTDLDPKTLAKLVDVFYIGGTKVGALFGEAVVFKKAPKNFYTMTKQHGAMLAKGWLTALQFDVLFTDNLYFDISKHAIDESVKLKEVLLKHNLKPYLFPPTNQLFVELNDNFLKKLEEKVTVNFWEKKDEKTTIARFATSWYTKDSDIEALDKILYEMEK